MPIYYSLSLTQHGKDKELVGESYRIGFIGSTQQTQKWSLPVDGSATLMEAVDRFLAMLDSPKNGQSKVSIPIIADAHVQIAVLGQPTIKCVNVVQQYG